MHKHLITICCLVAAIAMVGCKPQGAIEQAATKTANDGIYGSADKVAKTEQPPATKSQPLRKVPLPGMWELKGGATATEVPVPDGLEGKATEAWVLTLNDSEKAIPALWLKSPMDVKKGETVRASIYLWTAPGSSDSPVILQIGRHGGSEKEHQNIEVTPTQTPKLYTVEKTLAHDHAEMRIALSPKSGAGATIGFAVPVIENVSSKLTFNLK